MLHDGMIDAIVIVAVGGIALAVVGGWFVADLLSKRPPRFAVLSWLIPANPRVRFSIGCGLLASAYFLTWFATSHGSHERGGWNDTDNWCYVTGSVVGVLGTILVALTAFDWIRRERPLSTEHPPILTDADEDVLRNGFDDESADMLRRMGKRIDELSRRRT